MLALEDRITPTPVITVAKIADATEGSSNGTFRFTRTGDTSSSLTVSYSAIGTAVTGVDYEPFPSSLVFPAGESTVDFAVVPIDNVHADSARDIDMTVWTGTGYTVGSPYTATVTISDDEGTPVYWVGGNGGSWSNSANWSNSSVPTSTTAVYFDAMYSSYGVTVPSTVTQLGELHFVNGYGGTVALSNNLSVRDLEIASAATLDQPTPGGGISGTDLTVTAAMLWTAGTVNSTAHLANLTLTGSSTEALFAPASAGTVATGSTINLNDGAKAVLKAGEIQLANNAEVNIEESEFTADPGVDEIAKFNVNLTGGISQINIRTGAWLKVISGRFDNFIPVKITGGSLVLAPATVASFGGKVDNVNNGPSFKQTSGATYLAADASLFISSVFGGMEVAGGILSVKCGSKPEDFDGNIIGALKITGGSILCDAGGGSRREWGQLWVNGDVTWTSGVYYPSVDAENPGENGDLWFVSGTFSIGGNATVTPTAIDGEENTVTPASDLEWSLLASLTAITNVNNTPILGNGWSFVQDQNNPVMWWHLKSN